MHFDVLVPHGTDADQAFSYGQEWLRSVGEEAENLKQERCNFCHSEPAGADVQKDIGAKGYYILKIEGCPD